MILQDESNNSFTRNTQQITSTAARIQIIGCGSTAEEDLFVYNGSGSLTLTSLEKQSYFFRLQKEGTGLFTISGIGTRVFSRTGYDGSGTFSTLNGAAKDLDMIQMKEQFFMTFMVMQIPHWNLITYMRVSELYMLAGIAETKQEFRVSVESETVLFRLYGELLFPDVRFIPNFNGGGTINIIGSGNESIGKTL